jgi:hypothetical protein
MFFFLILLLKENFPRQRVVVSLVNDNIALET